MGAAAAAASELDDPGQTPGGCKAKARPINPVTLFERWKSRVVSDTVRRRWPIRMPLVKHISEGKSATYGIQTFDDQTLMSTWRNRLHNERSGMTNKDNTGTNTVTSLIWHPTGSTGGGALASHKRNSELKLMQDFGYRPGTAAPELQSPRTVTPVPASSQQLRPPTATSVTSETRASFGGASGAHKHYLDTEAGRLQASAHARLLGQTFLLQGNLAQAKLFLNKAEELLKVDAFIPPK